MKEVKYYACTICGHISTDRADIVKCEEGHIKDNDPVIIKQTFNTGVKYPHTLEVKFADGKTHKYFNFSMTVSEDA